MNLVLPAILGLVVMWPLSAQAQGDRQRSGGLFGATRSDTADRNRLSVLFAVTEGFETRVPVELQAQIPHTGPQSGGFSTMLTASAEYLKTGRRFEVGGAAQSAFRYYQATGVTSDSHSAGLQARLNMTRTATLQLNQTAAYSPSYLFQLFPDPSLPGLDEPIAVEPESRVRETESYSYRTRVTFGVGSTSGNRFSLSGDYGRTEFRRRAVERRDMENYSGRAKYSRGIGRNGRVSTEYEYLAGEMGLSPFTEHRLNLGVEYSRALSTSRRATFRFSLSPSTLEVSQSAQRAPLTEPVFRLQGYGAVDYQFRRTWRASGSYRRGVDYVAILAEPIFADSARMDLSGLVTRRVDVSISAAVAAGESAMTSGNRQLDTYTGTAKVRFALRRTLALYTEYFYYFYDLQGSSVEPDRPDTFGQHGIRFGLTFWVPVF